MALVPWAILLLPGVCAGFSFTWSPKGVSPGCNGSACSPSTAPTSITPNPSPVSLRLSSLDSSQLHNTSHNSYANLKFNFTGYPKLDLCMQRWGTMGEGDLIAKGIPPTLIFIKYPASNILEPMFRGIHNISEANGFVVMRNAATRGVHIPYRVVINFEEPNGMFIENDPGSMEAEYDALLKREARYNHSFTMCPFSAAWVNAQLGRCHRTPMWQSMPENMIRPFVPLAERRYDIVYMSANSNTGPVKPVLQQLFPKYKSRWFLAKRVPGFRTSRSDVRQPLSVRLRATAQSKMAMIINALFYEEPLRRVIDDYRRRPILALHGAFNQFKRAAAGLSTPLEGMLAVPQMKSRTFEAAMSGALMMVFNDGENIIERYYEPDTEFLYWYNTSDLERLMNEVLANPAAYDHIAYRAYAKTKELYTTEKWVQLLVSPFVQSSRRT